MDFKSYEEDSRSSNLYGSFSGDFVNIETTAIY